MSQHKFLRFNTTHQRLTTHVPEYANPPAPHCVMTLGASVKIFEWADRRRNDRLSTKNVIFTDLDGTPA